MKQANPLAGHDGACGDAPDDYARFLPALRGFFLRRLGHAHMAEDLAQDVMVRMHARSQASAILNLEAYIFQTASSVLRDHLRRESVRGVVVACDPADLENNAVELGPDRVLQARDELARVASALNELPERTRDIFLMRRYEGLAYGEIAQRVGISVSALEKHMTKAIAHLARRLAK
ncbi:RNA polymerase sigma factor [Novosphingobium sp. 1949]|uniref:RNA polymerase sigma factor n=1 Tax=Novosphingobium organovorum TaxID=2930092 RepID=A0ABT0BJD0_9SPHN|nr:RNA polymerase sigma factor [Novosphingobium organovorum]MCJ2185055.1 RNA polymerase sigma factor [Novosphingobium organovorum]